jgi:hypothetical protein
MRFERLNKDLRRIQSSQNFGLTTFKLPKGETILRILPAAPGENEEDFYLYVGQHFNVDPSKRPLVCRKVTDGFEGECPICDFAEELAQEGREEEAKAIAVQAKYFIRAIIRGQEEKGAQIVPCPVTVFGGMAAVIGKPEVFGEVLDIKEGLDFQIIKTGDGFKNTRYQVQAIPKPKPLLPNKAAAMDLIQSLKPIRTIAPIPSVEELKKALTGEDEKVESAFAAGSKKVEETWEDEEEESKDDKAMIWVDPEDGEDWSDPEKEEEVEDEEKDVATKFQEKTSSVKTARDRLRASVASKKS